MSDALDILGIFAHPDDAELLAGGTFARAASEGKRVGVIDLAAGESGTRGDRATRVKEAERAASVLGLAVRENLGLPDARLEPSVENRLLLAARIRALRPDVVVVHHAAGRNPDHHAASTLAREACYAAGLAKLAEGGAPHRPRRLVEAVAYLNVLPTLVVDITPAFEKKMESLRAYASQFDGAAEAGDILANGRDSLLDQVEFRSRAYGALVQVPYGEPFLLREPLRADGLAALPGRTI